MILEIKGFMLHLILCCVGVIIAMALLLLVLFCVFLFVHYFTELAYKIKVNRKNRKIFWYYVQHQEKIKKYFYEHQTTHN